MKPKPNKRLSESLRGSHHEIEAKLKAIISQLEQQADSTFGNNKSPWSRVSYPEFGNHLLAFAESLANLAENFNSGQPPRWWQEQQRAYEQSAIGRLSAAKKRREQLKGDNND